MCSAFEQELELQTIQLAGFAIRAARLLHGVVCAVGGQGRMTIPCHADCTVFAQVYPTQPRFRYSMYLKLTRLARRMGDSAYVASVDTTYPFWPHARR